MLRAVSSSQMGQNQETLVLAQVCLVRFTDTLFFTPVFFLPFGLAETFFDCFGFSLNKLLLSCCALYVKLFCELNASFESLG